MFGPRVRRLSKILPESKLLEDEFLNPFASGQMEPYEVILPFPTDLEPKERAALPFQLDPFDQLAGAYLCSVHLEHITVRELKPFLGRTAERIDEPAIARPLPRSYSVDVAGQFRRHRPTFVPRGNLQSDDIGSGS